MQPHLIVQDEPNNKLHSFYTLQLEWWGRPLVNNEQIIVTKEQLQMIHDQAHERGRIRERSFRSNGFQIH